VFKEGEVGAGDEFLLLEKNASGVKVVNVTQLYGTDKQNVALMRHAIATEALPASWREYFRKRLENLADL
jgi:MOSC domain-containing protein YiiM